MDADYVHDFFMSLQYQEICAQLVLEKDTENTLETGNTGSGFKVRARHFQLTLNEVNNYDKLYNYLTGYSTLKYLISCRETAPTTGHEHIHVYIQFSQPKIIEAKNLYGAHIEKCRGTPQQNRDYIVKDGNILDEVGTFKTNGGICGHTIADVIKMSNDELYEIADYKYYNVIQKIINDKSRLTADNHYKPDMNVIYVIGGSGMGKSKFGYKIVEKLAVPGTPYDEVSYANGFWLGVFDSHIAVYDDFRDSVMKPNEFIRFIDYNKHILNVKCGQKINEYTTIIITSKQAPWMLWDKSNEEKKQWLRRMDVYQIVYDKNHKKKLEKINVNDYYLIDDDTSI